MKSLGRAAGRNPGIDWMKLLAAWMVIAIHTYPFQSVSGTAEILFTRTACRLAVPLFLPGDGLLCDSPVHGEGRRPAKGGKMVWKNHGDVRNCHIALSAGKICMQASWPGASLPEKYSGKLSGTEPSTISGIFLRS